jgi:septation ring formation regulator EzrA
MKLTIYYIITTYLIFFLYSCDNVKSVDARLSHYVEQIAQSKSNMSESDWNQADLKIEAFKNEIENNRLNLTEAQILDANKAIGRYTGLRLKNGIKDLGNQLKDLGGQIEGVINELSDTPTK